MQKTNNQREKAVGLSQLFWVIAERTIWNFKNDTQAHSAKAPGAPLNCYAYYILGRGSV